MNSLDTKVARFDELLKEITRDIRDRFSVENLGELYLKVSVSGRTDGDLKIIYSVGEDSYSSSEFVNGNDLYDCMVEYLRRHGWKERHAPLSITAA